MILDSWAGSSPAKPFATRNPPRTVLGLCDAGILEANVPFPSVGPFLRLSLHLGAITREGTDVRKDKHIHRGQSRMLEWHSRQTSNLQREGARTNCGIVGENESGGKRFRKLYILRHREWGAFERSSRCGTCGRRKVWAGETTIYRDILFLCGPLGDDRLSYLWARLNAGYRLPQRLKSLYDSAKNLRFFGNLEDVKLPPHEVVTKKIVATSVF